MAESKHADTLRERGLEKVTIPRRERRFKSRFEPQFTVGTLHTSGASITYVTDEVGQRWMSMSVVDLTDIGFKNASPEIRKVLEEIGSIPKAN